jgi:hypothetical protein
MRITSSNRVTSPRRTGAPIGTSPNAAAPGLRVHAHHRFAAGDQPPDESRADEAGRADHEHRHVEFSFPEGTAGKIVARTAGFVQRTTGPPLDCSLFNGGSTSRGSRPSSNMPSVDRQKSRGGKLHGRDGAVAKEPLEGRGLEERVRAPSVMAVRVTA